MASRDQKVEITVPDRSGTSLLALARQAQQARINCGEHFPKHVFRDSAWDIMLELFAVSAEGLSLCVKDVMAISGESATGTIRRIESLEEANLIVRRPDPCDHRRMLVELSDKGRTAMISFLHHLFDVGEAATQGDAQIKPVSFAPVAPRRSQDIGFRER